MRLEGTKFHFIGIGGIGMCGLAELLHNLGAVVSGSDLKSNKNSQALEKLGIQVMIGHEAKNVGDVDVLVYSSAVKKDNVEFVTARERNIPVIPRAEALAEIMRLKRGIAVGGTHGKTTTTSLLASLFLKANQDPTIAVGGRLDLIKSTAKLGEGQWFIAEADESDGSFKLLSPEIVIVTNIDDDHMDHYKEFYKLQRAFYDFAASIPFYGQAIVCGDDPKTVKLFEDFPKKIVFYGFGEDNDYVLSGSRGQYSIKKRQGGQAFISFSLPMPGDHNALNATAALVAGHVAGIPEADLTLGIETFAGVDRRFQLKGQCNLANIYDDYGHHPTEVQAVLKAAKENFRDKNLIALFQPHRYTRFQNCWTDFLKSFDLADQVFVLPVFEAGEAPIDKINSQVFFNELDHKNKHYSEDQKLLVKELKKSLCDKDLVITLGAGDIWKIGEELVD